MEKQTSTRVVSTETQTSDRVNVRLPEARIFKKKEQIASLLNEIIALEYKQLLSKATKFTTEKRNWGTKKDPIEVVLKIMHYPDAFQDVDQNDTVTVLRQIIVEIDGHPVDTNRRRLREFKSSDINTGFW